MRVGDLVRVIGPTNLPLRARWHGETRREDFVGQMGVIFSKGFETSSNCDTPEYADIDIPDIVIEVEDTCWGVMFPGDDTVWMYEEQRLEKVSASR